MKNFGLIAMCVLLIAVARFGLSIPLRIALVANAILIIIDIICSIWRFDDGREESKN